MNILVVGAGAAGGYFGARLVQGGRDVTFLLRPARAAAVRADGIRITGQGPDEVVAAKVITTDELAAPYDVVLLAVKSRSLGAAMDDLAPAVGPTTRIVPFLNGMRHMGRLNERFGTGAVLGGVARVLTTLDDGGRIVRLAPWASLTVGAQPGGAAAEPASLSVVAETLDAGGYDVVWSDDIVGEMWDKWVFIATLGALTCLMRGAVGEIVAVPGGAHLGLAVLREVLAVAAVCGFALPAARYDAIATSVTEPGSALASSLYRDLTSGRLTEADAIVGDLVARARERGVETPILELAAMQLEIHDRRAGAAHSGD